MKTRNAVIVLSLVFVLVLGSFTMSFASDAESQSPAAQENINTTYANTLNSIGLFQGTSNGFELDNKATRIQGIIMFIRILGQENAALAGGSDTTFTDVPAWGKAYTAYAEKQGLTYGQGNGIFGSNYLMNPRDYATFLLRGLGYSDSEGDFTYTDSLVYLEQIGAISKEEREDLEYGDFTRGDMARLSYRALCTPLKGTETPLVEKLGLGTVKAADGGSGSRQIQPN